MRRRQLTLGAIKLRKWRLGSKKTQVEMADLIPCDQSGYSKFENGRRIPRRATRKRIHVVTGGAVAEGDWERAAPSGRRTAEAVG